MKKNIITLISLFLSLSLQAQDQEIDFNTYCSRGPDPAHPIFPYFKNVLDKDRAPYCELLYVMPKNFQCSFQSKEMKELQNKVKAIVRYDTTRFRNFFPENFEIVFNEGSLEPVTVQCKATGNGQELDCSALLYRDNFVGAEDVSLGGFSNCMEFAFLEGTNPSKAEANVNEAERGEAKPLFSVPEKKERYGRPAFLK